MAIEKSIENFQKIIPLFPQYIVPNGGLTQERASHACFYYYIVAREKYEQQKDLIVVEGDRDPVFDYKQLFTSIATLYEVDPVHMANAWDAVDTTCLMNNLPILPREDRYRQTGGPVIII